MTEFIVGFDTETTGLEVQNDYIVQLCLIKFNSKTFETVDTRNWYIKPSGDFNIDPGAQEVTGISKEMILEKGVLLKDIWNDALKFIGDCDMLSYNGNHFDIPMLYHNLKREKLSFDFGSRKFYDSYAFEKKRASLKLGDVYKRYYGKEFENAHDALYDVHATIEVFKKQLEEIPDAINESDLTCISPEGFIKYNDRGDLVFKQGKYKSKIVTEICKLDPNYIKWVVANFSRPTIETIKNEFYKTRQQ